MSVQSLPIYIATKEGNTGGNAATSRGGDGFPTGSYFMIRQKGTDKCLTPQGHKNVEGVQIHTWPAGRDIEPRRPYFFYIDEFGALCHAASGLCVDFVDNVPILRRRRLVASRSNPWSHPLPLFSYKNSQIHVKFLSDPTLPSCSEEVYPNDSWMSDDFVLVAEPEKTFHMHEISDFSPWIPRPVLGHLPYDASANYDKQWRVLVEQIAGDNKKQKSSWSIVGPSDP